jgi:hypothetical protein
LNQPLPSLTVIAVVNKTLAAPDSFASLYRALEKQVASFDLVLVANGVDTEVGLQLKELVQSEPDTTVVFLNQKFTTILRGWWASSTRLEIMCCFLTQRNMTLQRYRPF